MLGGFTNQETGHPKRELNWQNASVAITPIIKGEKGMALYKRKGSKFWWMKFTFDGQAVQRSTKCRAKRDAETVESVYRTELALGRLGIVAPGQVPAFDDAVTDFLRKAKLRLNPKSYAKYTFAGDVLKMFFGKTKVDKITKSDIEDFRVWRSQQTSRRTKQPITRGTINRETTILKQIVRGLLDARLLTHDPTRGVRLLPENDLCFHVITTAEEAVYLMACPQPLQDVATLMIETGMRPDEVYRLRRGDLFPEKRYVQVVVGKTTAARRRVYLNDRALALLTSRQERFTGEHLFPQNDIDGNRATRTLDDRHLATVRKLGFQFRLYDCRHTFATRALESGMDLLTLAHVLGHANIKMLSRYAHVSEQRKADGIRCKQEFEARMKVKVA
jgi:integrase